MENHDKIYSRLRTLGTSKDVVTWTDAALTIGMAYILGHYKDPDNEALGVNTVSCDSTTFERGKRSYSPFEALHWCVTKEDNYTRGARRILANCNAKSMRSFLGMDLDKMENLREQRMVERLMPYNIDVRYVPGKQMILA